MGRDGKVEAPPWGPLLYMVGGVRTKDFKRP
jgi:hypothetical protein